MYDDPKLVSGRWFFADGTSFPAISGGEDPPAPPPAPKTPPADPSKTFTQADVDRIVQERLARHKPADYDDLKRAADELAALKDKDKTDTQRLTDEVTTHKTEVATTKAELLRLQVALENAPEGMSAAEVAKYAKRIHGATREEMESDAKEFFESFGGAPTTGKPPTNKPNPRLTPAGGPADDPDPDVDEIVKKVQRL